MKLPAFLLAAFVSLPILAFGSTPPQQPPVAHDEWTWVSGADSLNQRGIYGTLGIASPGNTPGARVRSASWIDNTGTLWLFGGYGVDSTGPAHEGDLNDLWKFSSGEWTWVGGPDLADQPASYGTKHVPSHTNLPGPRYETVTWTDAVGNFWLFGGLGLDSTSTRGYLNDLWKYANGEWVWVAGEAVCCHGGKYGNRGKATANNAPGARISASTWTDSSGTLWLFGGFGYDIDGRLGILNDLWKFKSGNWAWVGGSQLANQFGVYGTQGVPSPAKIAGARSGAVTWIDANGPNVALWRTRERSRWSALQSDQRSRAS